MKNIYYTPATLISDVMKDNFRRQDSLDLLGITPGYNNCSSVKEVCDAQGVDCDFFLYVTNVYTFEDYDLESNISGVYPLESAIDYITRAHDFFLRLHVNDIRQNFEKVLPALDEEAKDIAAELLERMFDQFREHIDDINRIFDQHRQSPVSVNSVQVVRIFGQEREISATLDALILHLSEQILPDEFKDAAEHQVCYLFQFLRKDMILHEMIKNATLKRLIG